MSAFRFKLDPVLALRERQEKESAVGLARARQDQDTARRAREDLEAAVEAGRSRLAQAHGAGGPAGHLQNLALVVGSVGDRLRHADERCRAAEERVVESMKEFRHAFQQRRTMEQLRAKRREEWQSEQAKGEQKTMDEVALTRHGRGAGGRTEGMDA